MNVLIVYGSQFGVTEHFARLMADALAGAHRVEVRDVEHARTATGDEVDLLLVGAPTQLHGLRLLVRPFLASLARQAFVGVAAAAFDTRMEGPASRTGAAADAISRRLAAQGCRIVAPPAGFVLAQFQGEPASGEEDRAVAWALQAAAAVDDIPTMSA